jgi:hypothetical protein
MNARPVLLASSLAVALTAGACTSAYDIPVQRSVPPRVDVSAFQRVLVPGFLSGGMEDVDVNVETVRLLRSQLRSRSTLTVLDAEVLSLADIAAAQAVVSPAGSPAEPAGAAEPPPSRSARTPEDLQAHEAIFANAAFWQRIGDEHQNPLIVTGSILFVPHSRTGMEIAEQERIDDVGRRQVEQVRRFRTRTGFILSPRFVFIDGRSGAVLHAEQYREEILYAEQQITPPLASYFELFDRLLPSLLNTLSTRLIRTTRVLLK